ncbi:hypothetical protein [Nevskia soli]|uniref:hypothetical protein n=1 Tax=Nevskia soli TaxID=418856 RepID=UPI0004A6CC61|nr:hypothetical protein [Nevskia soli]
MVEKLPISLFMAASLITFSSWFYLVAEMIGMWRFWPWAYRTGLKVFEESVQQPLRHPLLRAIDLEAVKARMISPDEVLFRAPAPIFGFRINTPFPIKGTLLWSDSTAIRVIGRLPIGSVAFLGAWLVGWSTAGFFPKKDDLDPVSFVLFGWAIAGVMVAVSLPLELHRIRKAKEALVAYLQGARQ